MAVLRTTRVRLRGGSDNVDHKISQEKPRKEKFSFRSLGFDSISLPGSPFGGSKLEGKMHHSHSPLSLDSPEALQFPVFTYDTD